MQASLSLVSDIFLAVAVIFASKMLHNKLLKNILRCPMSFFDTTPVGRVLNRFSHDIFIIDTVIPEKIRSFLYRFIAAFRILLVIVVTTPIFAVVIIPLGTFYLLVQVRNEGVFFSSPYLCTCTLNGTSASTWLLLVN